VIRDTRSKDSIFSSLFAHFVRQQAPPVVGDTFVSRDPPVVQIDGQRIENLTELEFETLCYLYENRGRVCTKDELIENVYRQQYDRRVGAIEDARLQTLISRLRNKLVPNRRPRYIVTVRGEGYKFVEPDKQ
jgi:DNA-binding response OmpR family regulator